MDPWAATQVALQTLAHLCLRDPRLGDRIYHRLRRSGHGHRRWVPVGAHADLRAAGADSDGDRHLHGTHARDYGVRTVMHAAVNHLVDALLALFLMVGGVIGAQFGARAGQKMSGERLRLLLGLLVLAVGIRFALDLVLPPENLYSIRMLDADT